ncbi:MAG: 2-dehydropantoate 2-reductase [Nannocystaceae bacterium]|nr:2-dehydropantoate 2-reductase [Nannocystaceae bacterium]
MKVGIFWAGAIGASVGIRLSAAGVPVAMVARPSLIAVRETLVSQGLDGQTYRPGDNLVVDEDPAILGDVDLCLVTVKSRHTHEAAATLANALPPTAAVLSLQNGLRNPERLRAALDHPVAGGMVSYNVVRPEPGAFVQATKGPILVGPLDGAAGDALAQLTAAARSVGIPLQVRPDIDEVMAGKLLLNLNNGICAVTGVTIANSIRSRVLRRCFAALMLEGLGVLRASGLRPRSIVGLPPGVIARLLALPDAIVLRVAKSLVAVDPAAKSSTLQDLEAGKPTEIDDLCGEIVGRGADTGTPAHANAVVTNAVHALEAERTPSFWSAERLLEALRVS